MIHILVPLSTQSSPSRRATGPHAGRVGAEVGLGQTEAADLLPGGHVAAARPASAPRCPNARSRTWPAIPAPRPGCGHRSRRPPAPGRPDRTRPRWCRRSRTPSRCMPSRPSEPASLTMPRSMSPRSYQSATNGFTRWSTNSRTVAWMSRSSADSRWSTFKQVQGRDAGHLRSIPATCWAAFSMSSSPSSTCWAAVPNGTKEFRLDDPTDRPGEAVLDQPGDDALADPAIMPGLVDHQHPAGRCGLDQHVLDRQRREPAQVADPGGDALGGGVARPPAGSSAPRCRT